MRKALSKGFLRPFRKIFFTKEAKDKNTKNGGKCNKKLEISILLKGFWG